MVINHIYIARAISLLFWYHQDTESESCEMELSTSKPLFSHKNIKGFIRQGYQYSTRLVKIIVVFLRVYESLPIFPLFCAHQDTEYE